MQNDKNVILNSYAQWSLVLFMSAFVVGALLIRIIGALAKGGSFPSFFIFAPPVIIIVLYLTSIILGILSLKVSKFPLLWIIPCVLMVFILFYTSVTDFSRMLSSGITTVEQPNIIQPGKGLGISIGNDGEYKTQIVGIFYQSPAEKSGLKNGDIIISIQEIPVHNRTDIISTLNNIEESSLKVEVLRNGKEITVPVNR